MMKEEFMSYCNKLRQAAKLRILAKESSSSNDKRLQLGDQAPDFTLLNTANEQVALNDLLEKSSVILLFIPSDFTIVSEDNIVSIPDNVSKYTELNATVIGISVNSMSTLIKFQEEHPQSYDLLCDSDKSVAQIYGVLFQECPLLTHTNVTKFAVFVINQTGLIQYVDIRDDPELIPDIATIESVLNRCNEQ